jgi:hypothetical protein
LSCRESDHAEVPERVSFCIEPLDSFLQVPIGASVLQGV